MPDLELLVKETLERQVPLREAARPDWADVLQRAEIVQAENGRTQLPAAPAATRRRPRRRLLVAAAVVLVAAAAYPFGPALAGLGRDAFDGLGSWLRGEPGTPAPAAEQAGFSERNAASYASFPSGTKLRLLLRPTAGGKTFALLGLRTESSLCLRLVRADRLEGRGANECVTLRELTRSPAPALVVSEAWFSFGEDAIRADGVFGFADDTVAAIEVRRVRSGWRSVDVSSNVFVALRARPSGSVKNPGPYDPIVQVRAVRHDGERVRVPFVAGDSAVYAQGLPSVPSYLGSGSRSQDLPGPSTVQARFRGGTIAWLEAREPRGEPFSLDRRPFEGIGSVVYARKIQPDPDNPVRIGAWLVRVGERSRMRNVEPGTLMICASELRALGRGSAGGSCPTPGESGAFPPGRPLLFTSMGPEQLTQLAGLAADGVAAIDLYLASGRVIPAALRDNAFVVQAPTVQLPGKLVAYDDERRVIGIQPIYGALKPVPCPPASFGGPPQAPEPYERIDLGTARIDGHEIIGRSVAEVRAALGRPDRVAYFSRTNNVREPTLFYGGARPENVALQVRFGVRQGRLRAFSLSYQSLNLVDARLGHVLRMQPLELQRRISAAYGDRWKLGVAYGSRPGYGCVGSFDDARKTMRISFGVNPYGGARRPTLDLWHGY